MQTVDGSADGASGVEFGKAPSEIPEGLLSFRRQSFDDVG